MYYFWIDWNIYYKNSCLITRNINCRNCMGPSTVAVHTHQLITLGTQLSLLFFFLRIYYLFIYFKIQFYANKNKGQIIGISALLKERHQYFYKLSLIQIEFGGFRSSFIFIYLFFIAACGLSLIAESRGYSSLRRAGFSSAVASPVAEHGL